MNNKAYEDKIKRSLEGCPAGVFCYFIKLNSLWGVKCYTTEHNRDLAFKRQSSCYDEGLGPEAKECFDFSVDYYDEDEDVQVNHLWCYVTECITPCIDICDYSKDIESECRIFEENYEKDIWMIACEIQDRTGWLPSDVHGYNWGWNDGKLQLLDFL